MDGYRDRDPVISVVWQEIQHMMDHWVQSSHELSDDILAKKVSDPLKWCFNGVVAIFICIGKCANA